MLYFVEQYRKTFTLSIRNSLKAWPGWYDEDSSKNISDTDNDGILSDQFIDLADDNGIDTYELTQITQKMLEEKDAISSSSEHSFEELKNSVKNTIINQIAWQYIHQREKIFYNPDGTIQFDTSTRDKIKAVFSWNNSLGNTNLLSKDILTTIDVQNLNRLGIRPKDIYDALKAVNAQNKSTAEKNKGKELGREEA